MKKLSRLLALMLIVLMLASLCVSCKKKADDEDEAIASAGDDENSGTEGADKDEGEKDDGSDKDAQEGGNSDGKTEQTDKDDNSGNTSTDMPKPNETEGTEKGDGAGKYKIFGLIALPIAKSGIVLSFLFSFVWYWNETRQAGLYFGTVIKTLPMKLGNFAV